MTAKSHDIAAFEATAGLAASAAQALRIAIFAGSFNPFTIGHADIVRRGLEIFDRIIISVGVNIAKGAAADAGRTVASAPANPCMESSIAIEATIRPASAAAPLAVEKIAELYKDEPRVTVVAWHGLTADLAKKFDARFLLRGVRSVKDYEYERDMADANRAVFGLETVILYASPELAYVTSSLVRELQAYGEDVSRFLP